MRVTTVSLNSCIDLELVVDAIKRDDITRVRSVRRDAAGKAINVARMVRELGDEALAIALLGGPTGALIEQTLRDDGLPARVVRTAGETRTNFTITETASGSTSRLNMAGPTVGDAEYQACRDAIHAEYANTDWLVLSGSLPPGIALDAYREIAMHAREAGLAVLVDADGEPLRYALEARPTLIKPNQHELARLTGNRVETPEEAGAAAWSLLADGPDSIVVSLGSQGAVWAWDGGALAATPPPVEVASTVGCGDALNAGILHVLGRGGSRSEALRMGVALGTASAMLPGTEFCDPRHAGPLAERVTIREWNR